MKFMTLLIGILFVMGCREDGANVDIKESGQQIGALMSDLDENGGDSGAFALVESEKKLFVKHIPQHNSKNLVNTLLINDAVATQCSLAGTFSSCSSNTITRNFGGCTVGSYVLSGDVQFVFNDNGNACAINDISETVTRSPDFTIAGPRGGALTVFKEGTIGQRLTRTGASSFSFSSDGIRRQISIGSTIIFDFTTQTTSDISITGNSRNGRVVTGGTFLVTNNRSSRVCSVSPTNVTWSSTCTCATSGSWAGSCSDGKDFDLNITGCGTAQLTIGNDTESFNFYRCESI